MGAVNDWERFCDAKPWLLRPGRTALAGEPHPWTRGPVDGLPELSALLASAEVTPVSVGDDAYEVLAWGPADDRRAWLCLPPHREDGVAPAHRAFWAVCGGMVELLGGPSGWWDDQDQVLTPRAAREPFADALDAYAWLWEQDGLTVPIEAGDYYAVAVEGNANLTLARRDDGRLLLFAPDHDFDGVTPLAGCPPYSLLTIDDVPDLTTWIETCAAAWRRDGSTVA